MIKKISAVLLAVTLTFCSLTGCNKKNEEKDNSSSGVVTFDPTANGSLKIDGKKIDTKKFTMCTIDGTDIDFDTFRYYYFNTLSYYQQYYQVDMSTINKTKDGFKTFMDEVVNALKQEVLIKKLAKENGCELTDKQKKTIDETMKTTKSQYDNDAAFEQAIASQYHTEKTYRNYLEVQQLMSNVTEKLFKNEGKYATKYDDFKKIIQDESKYAHELHVMIPYCAMAELSKSDKKDYNKKTLEEKLQLKYTAYSKLDDKAKAKAKAKAKKTAEEVLQKAQNGEDFKTLVKKYGWDVTLEKNPEGLYLNKETAVTNGYPKALVDAAFKAKVGEVYSKIPSDDTYGYFVIKRLDADMKNVEKNISDLTFSYDSSKISDTMNKLMEKMSVKHCDKWDKITSESIS